MGAMQSGFEADIVVEQQHDRKAGVSNPVWQAARKPEVSFVLHQTDAVRSIARGASRRAVAAGVLHHDDLRRRPVSALVAVRTRQDGGEVGLQKRRPLQVGITIDTSMGISLRTRENRALFQARFRRSTSYRLQAQ